MEGGVVTYLEMEGDVVTYLEGTTQID